MGRMIVSRARDDTEQLWRRPLLQCLFLQCLFLQCRLSGRVLRVHLEPTPVICPDGSAVIFDNDFDVTERARYLKT